jgi:hypothetical protein
MAVLLAIKNLFVKIIYTLFGRTRIFVILLGWFLVITGVWMLARPEAARKSMISRGFGQAKWIILILVFFLGSLLLSIASRIGGDIPAVIAVAGIIMLAVGYFRLRKKSFLVISSWVQKVPLAYLKMYAVIQIVIGALMLLLQRRII